MAMNRIDLQDLATVEEAAALLHVSVSTMRGWLSQEKLPRIKAGRRTLVSKAALARFLRVESGCSEHAAA